MAVLNLPEASEVALKHSNKLCNAIRQQIDHADGKITFADFMQLALYAPGLGYYSANNKKFGEDGDFITAPELSELFSRALAEQCAEVLPTLNNACIIEFGAGTGVMAAAILLHLQQLNCLPEKYFILELSADLIQRQQQTLRQECAELLDRVEWLDHLPEQPLNAIVLANEVLDAMPIELFRVSDPEILQGFVSYDQNNFNLVFKTSQDEFFQNATNELRQQITFTPDYQSEINLMLHPWMRGLSDCIAQGVVLLIDYGYPRSEYYHPQRNQGTLQCFYRHLVHDDFFQLIGLQDITANVDFTAVAEAAVEADFSVLGYTSQGVFLLNNHLLELAKSTNTKEQFNLNQQVKFLTLPNEMGEKFKVIALGKNYERDLQGFAQGDKLHLL